MASHDERLSNLLFRLDKTCIALLFAAIGASCGNQHFARHGQGLRPWFLLANTVLATLVAKNLLSAETSKRFTIFLLGLQTALCITPVLRELQLSGDEAHNGMVVRHLTLANSWVVFGSACFALHVPERFAPGAFDKLGTSHNIMHTAVLIGTMYCYRGSCKWYKHRKKGEEDKAVGAGGETLRATSDNPETSAETRQ